MMSFWIRKNTGTVPGTNQVVNQQMMKGLLTEVEENMMDDQRLIWIITVSVKYENGIEKDQTDQ